MKAWHAAQRYTSTLPELSEWTLCKKLVYSSDGHMQSFGTIAPIMVKAPNFVQMRLIQIHTDQ